MNDLRAMAGISRRETISIERIRRMNCVVCRTLTTKSEREFFNNDLQSFTPRPGGSQKEKEQKHQLFENTD